ncbi:MAG: spermidine synthase [Actinomycetota bacterium]
MAEVVERARGVCGELVLRRRGQVFEIIANGTFLMDTGAGDSERLLVRAAADRLEGPGRVMIAGLGVGFSLAEALAHPRISRVDVIEREQVVVRWNRTHLRTMHGDALSDPRVHVHEADVVPWLAAAPAASLDAICLDVDNGPDWLVTPGNAWLYGTDGIVNARRVLSPGGVLATWTAAPAPEYVQRLREHFAKVEELPVDSGGRTPDVAVIAQGSLADPGRHGRDGPNMGIPAPRRHHERGERPAHGRQGGREQ